MRPGLPTSIALHAAVLGWALVSFAATPPLDAPASDPIDVELLPPTQVSQSKLGDKTGKPSDQITPKDTKASAKESDGQRVGDTKTEEPPPPPPPEQKPSPPVEKPQQTAAVPPPEPKPEPPKPEPPRQVAKVEPTPAPTPPPPKPDLPKEAEKAKDIGAGKPPEVKDPPKDQKALEKLLEEAKKADKPPEKKPDPPKPAEKPAPKAEPIRTAAINPSQAKSPSQMPSPLHGATSDVVNRVDTGMSASKLQQHASLGNPTGPVTNLKLSQSDTEALIGALKAQITPCWLPPPSAGDSGVKVMLEIDLNPDGTLQDVHMISAPPPSPMVNNVIRSAIQAVKMCASQQPFKMPANKYGAWATNHVTFDPKYQ